MTVRKTVLSFMILIMISILTCLGVAYYNNVYLPKMVRNNLAKELGISSMEDYPPFINFPYSYYVSMLQPGMSLSEVHKVMKGYQRVLNCDYRTEMYYFYSSDDDKALRMEIRYDTEDKFREIVVEDLNSRTFRIDTCKEGFLQ